MREYYNSGDLLSLQNINTSARRPPVEPAAFFKATLSA